MNKISAKIDVTKILKEHLFHGKNGAKYLDVILIPTPDGQYGNDYMVVQEIPRELRDQGQKGPILGNAKIFGNKGGQQQQAPPQGRGYQQRSRPPQESEQEQGWAPEHFEQEDDIPF